MKMRQKQKLCGTLVGLALSPVLVPMKLLGDMNKAERGAKNRRKGRQRKYI